MGHDRLGHTGATNETSRGTDVRKSGKECVGKKWTQRFKAKTTRNLQIYEPTRYYERFSVNFKGVYKSKRLKKEIVQQHNKGAILQKFLISDLEGDKWIRLILFVKHVIKQRSSVSFELTQQTSAVYRQMERGSCQTFKCTLKLHISRTAAQEQRKEQRALSDVSKYY